MSEWDKLWEEIKLESLTSESDLSPFRVMIYLKNLKAEGDRMQDQLGAIKNAYESHRDNILELSGNLSKLAHEEGLPEEYHYALEKIATNMISYGEIRKILEDRTLEIKEKEP